MCIEHCALKIEIMHLIGLILLALISFIAFFGFGRRFFNRLEIKPWLMFLFLALFTFGAILPSILFSEYMQLSIGGVIVPLVFAAIIFYATTAKVKAGAIALAILIIAAVTLGLFMIIRPDNLLHYKLTALAIGFSAGGIAYVVIKNRAAIIVATMVGIVLGDALYNLISRFIFERPLALGANATFDALILAPVVALIILEVIEFRKKRAANKKVSLLSNKPLNILQQEAAQDIDVKAVQDKEIFAPFE